ncbi:MAG: hypothetical protein Udaeo2_28500 [Candidatus Udaeobacter sp.]|nr:MAG: hypothetical protein Udaeo2_28500 [Candidatus Udaeobacter sp.]
MKWHFQFTPHDARLGFDAHADPLRRHHSRPAAQARRGRQPQRVLLRARSRHRRLPARQAAHQVTWAKEIDGNGRPVVLPNTDPTAEGNRVCPSGTGGTNWHSPSSVRGRTSSTSSATSSATRSCRTRSSSRRTAGPAVHRQRVLPDARRAAGERDPRRRSQDRERALGVPRARRRLGGRLLDRWRPRVLRRRTGNFIALDAETGKISGTSSSALDQHRCSELLGGRPPVRRHRGGRCAVRVRAAEGAVTTVARRQTTIEELFLQSPSWRRWRALRAAHRQPRPRARTRRERRTPTSWSEFSFGSSSRSAEDSPRNEIANRGERRRHHVVEVDIVPCRHGAEHFSERLSHRRNSRGAGCRSHRHRWKRHVVVQAKLRGM